MPLFALPTSLRLLERLHGNSSVPVVLVSHMGRFNLPKGNCSIYPQDRAWSDGRRERQVAALWANPVAAQQFHGGIQAALENLISGDDEFHEFIHKHLERLRTGETSWPALQNTYHLATTCTISLPNSTPTEFEVSAVACILEHDSGLDDAKCAAGPVHFQCCFLPWACSRPLSDAPKQPNPGDNRQDPYRQSEELFRRPETSQIALLLQFHAVRPTAAAAQARPPHLQSPSPSLQNLPPTLPPTPEMCSTQVLEEQPSQPNPPTCTLTDMAAAIIASSVPAGRGATIASSDAAPTPATWLPFKMHPQPCTYEVVDLGTRATCNGLVAEREEALSLHSTLRDTYKGAALQLCTTIASAAGGAAAAVPIAAAAATATAPPLSSREPKGESWHRSCMVLAALPVCVSLFDRQGCVLFQNAVSMYYFGPRSNMPQLDVWRTAAGTATGEGAAAAGTATGPVGLSSAQRPSAAGSKAVVRGATSRGLLSKLMALRCSSRRKKAMGGCDGGGANEDSHLLGTAIGDGVGLAKALEHKNILLDLFAFELEKLEEMWAVTAIEGGTWQGMVRVPRTLNPESVSSFASGITEASCPEDGGCVDASRRAAAAPEASSVVADSSGSVAAAGRTTPFPQGVAGESGAPDEAAFPRLREGRLPTSDRILESSSPRKIRGASPLAPRQPQSGLDEQRSGLAAAEAASSCQFSRSEVQASNAQSSICLLPSRSSVRHLHPSGSTEGTGCGTSGGAVARAAAPVAAAFGPGEEARTGRPREALNRDVYCDDVFVHAPTADMSSLLDGSRSYLQCPSSGAGRYDTNVMAGPPGGAMAFLGSTGTTAPDGGGDGDGAVGGGPCTTADAPWALLAARQLGRFVSRIAATVGVGSSVPVAPSDGRRCIGARDNGAMIILHRAGSSHSRTGGGMSGDCNPSAATEMAACLDDPHQQAAGLLDATSPQLPSGGGGPGSLTNKRSKVLSTSVFQSFGSGVRRLARGRSGIGSGSGPREGARVQLSCASFCNAAGVSTARGPLVPLLTERRAGVSPLPTSSTAVSAVDASVAAAATDGDGSHTQRWSQRDMMIGDPAPMAAAAAATGPRPRSGSRHRRRSHSGAAQRRWASVNTLSTSTWQVAFGGSGLKAPPVYGHLMVPEPRPHLPSRHCPEARGSTESPYCGDTAAGAAEARQLQPTIGGADGATATVAGSATGPTTAADLDTSMPTRSASDCCLVDAAGSGCAAVQSSSPSRGGWAVPPPSSTTLDLDACETSVAAAAAPQSQTPRPIGRPGEPWAASAVGATEASRPTAPGKNGTADKLRPLSGGMQPRMFAGGDDVHSPSSRGGGSRCGNGFGYGGNGASSPPVLVPRGQLLVAYNSSSGVSRDSRAQSFESNLNAAFASNTSMMDRARAQDANVALLAISPSRLGGGGAGIGGGGAATAAALSSRVVTFAASLRTAPKTYSAAAAAAGAGRVTARSKSDRRMLKRYTGGDRTTFTASSISRASFSQPGPHHSTVFSSTVDRSAFWTVRYTNGDSSVSDELLYATEGAVEEPDKAFGGNCRQRRYAASCYNSGGGGSTAATVRDKVSQLRAVSEHASTLIGSAGTYRRITAKRSCNTSLGMATGSTTTAAAAETELARKTAAVAGNVRYGDEEIQACEEAGVPVDAVGLTDVMVTAGPSGLIHDAANSDAAGQRRKPYGQPSFCSDGASGAESGAQHRMQSLQMSPGQDSGTTCVDATEAMVSTTTAEANVTAGTAGAGAGAPGEAELSSECWHEVIAVGVVDPASGRRGVLVMQRDVTAKVVAERHVTQVSETEHRLLEQIFPRHVLQYIMEESGLWAASADEASAAEPDADLEQNPSSMSTISATTPVDAAAIARWRPYVRDCNRLAVWHPQVTVLFADIQGFTPMCKVLPPDVVMSFLNTLFTRFDAMLDRHHVYKVETIGDCYMVAGGLIREDEDGMASVQGGGHVDPDQAGNVFAFAKAMLAAASSVALPTTGAPVKVRVGIHSGPVVSGVVGTRMPRFCLFGDTVNTASRMESSGVAGCIHVSEECFQLLRQRDPVAAEGWEATGGIEVKGKGIMRTHLWTPDHLRAQAAITVPAATTANTTGTTLPTGTIKSATTMATAAITANAVPPTATSSAVCRDPQEQLQKITQETVLGTAVIPPPSTDTSGAVAAPGLLSSVATRPSAAPFLGHAWTLLGARSEGLQRERDQALGHGVTSVGGGSGCGGLAVSNMSSAFTAVIDAFEQHGANAGNSAICIAQKTTGTASVASGAAGSRASGVTTAGDRAGRGGGSISNGGCEAGCARDSASGGGSAGVEAGDDGHRRGVWNGVGGERSNLGQDPKGGQEPDVSKEAGPPINSLFSASCHTTSTDLQWSSRHAMDLLDPTICTTVDSVALGSTSTRRALAGASTGGSGRGGYHMLLRGSSPALTAAATAAAAGPVGGMSDARRHRPEHRLDLLRNGESSIQAFQPSTSPGAGTSGIVGSEAGSVGGLNSNLRGLNALEMANMSTASSVVLAEMLGMGEFLAPIVRRGHIAGGGGGGGGEGGTGGMDRGVGIYRGEDGGVGGVGRVLQPPVIRPPPPALTARGLSGRDAGGRRGRGRVGRGGTTGIGNWPESGGSSSSK